MADTKRICRVCGKAYTACRTTSNPAVFRWQDVACSPDCGEEYLRRVVAARAPKTAQKKYEPRRKHEPAEDPVVENETPAAEIAVEEN